MNENNSLDIVKSMTDSDFQAEIIENDRSNLQNKVAFPFAEMSVCRKSPAYAGLFLVSMV